MIHTGDCRELNLDDLADAIVCDPPYGLKFMGKGWDHGVPSADVWAHIMAQAKPGAHLLAFGGTRTYHRLMVAIEDAGWEIRDCIMWVYGSGFPKSRNLDGEWRGWGTALKPAWEPIIVARKPLAGTVAQNVLAHGCGALNIDGCRVATGDTLHMGKTGLASTKFFTDGPCPEIEKHQHVAGRWPANLIHDGSDEVLALFPAEAGAAAKVTKRNADKFRNSYGAFAGSEEDAPFYDDTGSAARFFQCCPFTAAEREAQAEWWRRFFYCAKASKQDRGEGNTHPTVKPNALMRYLCRLVTPPGGLVYDPFAGSGSTGVAAVQEGFRSVGCDLDKDHVSTAQRRLSLAALADVLAI